MHPAQASRQLESVLDNLLADIVDERERLLGPDGQPWEPIGGGGSAAHSDHWTPQAHAAARASCRQLAGANAFAINAIENRISYLVGSGHQHRVDGVHDKIPQGTIAAAQKILSRFLQRNQWPRRQQEIQRRYDRDGEVFLRRFVDDGETSIRFVDPERVHAPDSEPDVAPWGIETDPDDVETPRRYWVDNEPIDAADIQHRKANVDSTVLRGVPLLWPVQRNLKRAALLLRNMSALIEIQTAIAIIRKHRGASAAGIETWANNQADAKVSDQVTGRTHRFRQYGPGTILDVPEGLEYDFPTIGADAARMVEVLRAELRAIAARVVMPEFMLTSDASNAAYASTMVAEGPAVRSFDRMQAALIYDDLELMHGVLDAAGDAGRLPSNINSLVTISAEGPDPQVREYFKQHQIFRIAHASGVLSKQTWAQKLGLDYEHEQRQIHKHESDFPDHPADTDDHEDPAGKPPAFPRSS